jgi:hypothetical protein
MFFTLLDVIIVLVFAVLAYIIWEQAWTYKWVRNSGNLPGPKWVWPVIGETADMILRPWQFYEKQEMYGPISWNSLGGK